MKNYIVIGNPIEHSLSPKIHNYWFIKNKIKAKYQKKLITEDNLKDIVKKIKEKEIHGANITVPFKEKIIPFIDKLSEEAKLANSVNTIHLTNNYVTGHNTDIAGFYLSIKSNKFNFKNKKALILGAGGVTPSIIIALRRLGINQILISNRTKEKAVILKQRFKFIKILEWGEFEKADLVINATSLGLKKDDIIALDESLFGSNIFFYDVIYNMQETNFIKKAKNKGCIVQNGLMMFIHQAAQAFKIWHNKEPDVDKDLVKFLQND